jgi:uncharacterized protein YjdB
MAVSLCGIIFRGINMSFTLPDDRTAQINVTGADARGNAAPLENITYTSSDETKATVDAAGLITPVGLGAFQVTINAYAQIGDGITLLTGLLDAEVVAGQAVTLAVNASLV